jgi:hypothetical protein
MLINLLNYFSLPSNLNAKNNCYFGNRQRSHDFLCLFFIGGESGIPCLPSSHDGRDVSLQQLSCLDGSKSKKEGVKRRAY